MKYVRTWAARRHQEPPKTFLKRQEHDAIVSVDDLAFALRGIALALIVALFFITVLK